MQEKAGLLRVIYRYNTMEKQHVFLQVFRKDLHIIIDSLLLNSKHCGAVIKTANKVSEYVIRTVKYTSWRYPGFTMLTMFYNARQHLKNVAQTWSLKSLISCWQTQINEGVGFNLHLVDGTMLHE